MGASAGKSNTDTTTENAGQSQYENSGGQESSGYNNGYTNIQYLDPSAIAGQKQYYSKLLGQSYGNTTNAFNQATGLYSSLLSSPGYDQGTKNAISAIGNAAANEKLDEGRANAERHAAATGNDAGYTAGMSNLYGMGARDTASRANENQLGFYQEAQRQKELGGAGMERLYGTAQGAQLGLLGGMNNLSSLGSGSESGGSYQNEGSQYGNGSAMNNSNSHQAGSSTQTGGSGDLANGLGGILGALGLGGGGSNSKGGGNTLGDLLKNLFGGGGGSSGSQLGSGLRDGSGRSPSDPGYDPRTVQGVNDGNPSTIDTYDPNTGQVTHEYNPDPGDVFGDPDYYEPNGGIYGPEPDPNWYDPYADPGDGSYGPSYDPNYDPSLDPYYDPFEGVWD